MNRCNILTAIDILQKHKFELLVPMLNKEAIVACDEAIDLLETAIREDKISDKPPHDVSGKLFAYKFWDGDFHRLFFSRVPNVKINGFVRIPENDTDENME